MCFNDICITVASIFQLAQNKIILTIAKPYPIYSGYGGTYLTVQ